MSSTIIIKTADITQEGVDAIVNAANASLLGGGGVDGAIHRAGGSEILKACQEIRHDDYPDGLPTGQAVATTAGNMPAKCVIHTVGPIYAHCQGDCQMLLENCYKNSLALALNHSCKSIAFPAISTGIYGYPKKEAAHIAYNTVKEFLDEGHQMEVRFIFHSDEGAKLFKEVNGIS